MSNSSVTPVATGTTEVFHSDPVLRFHQQIDIDLQVRDLERRIRPLARQLEPATRDVHGRPPRSRRLVWSPAL